MPYCNGDLRMVGCGYFKVDRLGVETIVVNI